MRRTINRQERDILFRWATWPLGGDMPHTREESWPLRDAMRLQDDIGWTPEDDRDSFELTMPDEQLERCLRWTMALIESHDADDRSAIERKDDPPPMYREYEDPGAQWVKEVDVARRYIAEREPSIALLRDLLGEPETVVREAGAK